MKVLVTGGAGFIGSNVVDSLIQRGDDVIVVDDLSNGKKENINPDARFYETDVRDKEIAEIFEKEKPEAVIHNAAQLSVRVSVEDPMLDASINILGIVNVLNNSVKNDVKKFVFASSGGTVYGDQDYFPADEDHPTNPISPYGIAKLASEKYLYYFNKEYGLGYIALRYANIYGPRQDPYGEAGVVAIFCNKILEGENPTINGDGLQTRDYVYVGDVVRANIASIESDYIGEINIGTAKESSVVDLFNILKQVSGDDGIEEIHGPAKQGETRRSSLSYDKAEQTLSWKPEISFDEGIRLTYEWFEENM